MSAGSGSVHDLIRGASLKGDATRFDHGAALRLGRALATLARRRRHADEPLPLLVVARSGDGLQRGVRDPLVAGLMLSGGDVLDLGVCSSDVFTFALKFEGAAGGVLLGDSESGRATTAVLFLGPTPLGGDALVSLALLADDNDFCAGAGRLRVEDMRLAYTRYQSVMHDDVPDTIDGGL